MGINEKVTNICQFLTSMVEIINPSHDSKKSVLLEI